MQQRPSVSIHFLGVWSSKRIAKMCQDVRRSSTRQLDANMFSKVDLLCSPRRCNSSCFCEIAATHSRVAVPWDYRPPRCRITHCDPWNRVRVDWHPVGCSSIPASGCGTTTRSNDCSNADAASRATPLDEVSKLAPHDDKARIEVGFICLVAAS